MVLESLDHAQARGANILAEVTGYALTSDAYHISSPREDGTLEGFRHRNLPAYSVQYHPESAPGPRDSRYLFKNFINEMKQFNA